jgi:hypothetical protein
MQLEIKSKRVLELESESKRTTLIIEKEIRLRETKIVELEKRVASLTIELERLTNLRNEQESKI